MKKKTKTTGFHDYNALHEHKITKKNEGNYGCRIVVLLDLLNAVNANTQYASLTSNLEVASVGPSVTYAEFRH